MFHANYSMIITSSTFTASAKEAIRKSPRIRGTEIEGLKRQFRKYFVITKPPKVSMIDAIKEIFTGKKSKKIVKRNAKPVRVKQNRRKY